MASKHHYYDTFNTKFNISFFHPKKDQCDKCVCYANATEEVKKELKDKHKAHIENKEKARNIKKEDEAIAKQTKETTNMIVFDFQKVLVTPKSEASSLYYKRKLSVYNFTIFDITRHEGFCYVWTENDANRGSNEVASCLYDYMSKRVACLGVNEFLLWSDNCAGQNRNKHVFAMYVYASDKLKINIKHSFLEVGHTQNQVDSVHAAIERHAKGRQIFTHNEWCEIIKNSKTEKPFYSVINVNFKMIYDFKDLSSQQNWTRTVMKKNKPVNAILGISKFKQVFVSKEKPNQLFYKCNFDDELEKLVLRKDSNQVNVRKYKLKKAYTGELGLPAAKLKDLLTLCNNYIIPPNHYAYYKAFSVRKSNDIESDISEDEN